MTKQTLRPTLQNVDVAIQNLSLSYGNNVVYKNFCHTFEQNKVHVILGKSGCGKTSLLNAVAGLVAFEGQITQTAISYVFQQPTLAKTTVFNNVDMVLTRHFADKNLRAEHVDKYLTLAEISNKRNCLVTKLSGGEQQRVSLARAFAFPSQLLLMDEPFKSLDFGIRKTLYKTFDNMLAQNPRTTLLVTHDVDDALALADNVYLLQDTPCVLTQVAQLNVPRQNRDLYSSEFVSLRKQLEQLL